MPRKVKFNWTGIIDNGDGTFTVDGKVARKRLLKEYHKQGLQVRSHKESDGTYTLSAIGSIRKTGGTHPRRPVRSIGQVRTRYPNVRRYPVRGRAPMLTRPRYPFGAGSSPTFRQKSSPNLTQGLGTKFKGWMQGRRARQQERENERVKQKQEMEITEAKLTKERKQAEQQELEKTTTKQRTHARLLYEQQEQRQQEILRQQQRARNMRAQAAGRPASQIPQQSSPSHSLHESISRSDQRAEQRRTDKIIAQQQTQRNVRQEARMRQGGYSGGSTSAPQIPKQEISKEQMDAARQRAAMQD